MKFSSVDHISQSRQMCASRGSFPGRSTLQHASPALQHASLAPLLLRFLPQNPAQPLPAPGKLASCKFLSGFRLISPGPVVCYVMSLATGSWHVWFGRPLEQELGRIPKPSASLCRPGLLSILSEKPPSAVGRTRRSGENERQVLTPKCAASTAAPRLW